MKAAALIIAQLHRNPQLIQAEQDTPVRQDSRPVRRRRWRR